MDLPGYGWATRSVRRASRGEWQGMIEGYLRRRASLRAMVILVDVPPRSRGRGAPAPGVSRAAPGRQLRGPPPDDLRRDQDRQARRRGTQAGARCRQEGGRRCRRELQRSLWRRARSSLGSDPPRRALSVARRPAPRRGRGNASARQCPAGPRPATITRCPRTPCLSPFPPRQTHPPTPPIVSLLTIGLVL